MNTRQNQIAYLNREIDRLEKELAPLRASRTKLVNEEAEELCPVNVGQAIYINHSTITSKKPMVRTYRITSVTARYGDPKHQNIRGKCIKKDGSLGAEIEIWQPFTIAGDETKTLHRRF